MSSLHATTAEVADMKSELVSIYPLAFRVEAETFYEKRILYQITEAGKNTIHFKEIKHSQERFLSGINDEVEYIVIYAQKKEPPHD